MTQTRVTHARRSFRQTFEDLRQRNHIGLFPFIPAGYPDLATTAALLPALERAGSSGLEIGIPFSDPVADGPTIQEAFNHALQKKVKVADVFSTIASVRKDVSIPLVAMVSYSVVFRYGLERFLNDGKAAGFDAMLFPDLPPPEAQSVATKIRAAGLDTVLLVAPTTSAPRRAEIAALCSGFVYYLSVTGITGERDRLPADLEQNVRQLRQSSPAPICVGFGISKSEHVAQLSGVADGAIVGSALVKRMKQHLGEGPEGIARSAEAYCRELLTQVY